MENFNNHKDCAGVDVAGQLGYSKSTHFSKAKLCAISVIARRPRQTEIARNLLKIVSE